METAYEVRPQSNAFAVYAGDRMVVCGRTKAEAEAMVATMQSGDASKATKQRLSAAAYDLLEASEWTARNAKALYDAAGNIMDSQQRIMFRDVLAVIVEKSNRAIQKATGQG